MADPKPNFSENKVEEVPKITVRYISDRRQRDFIIPVDEFNNSLITISDTLNKVFESKDLSTINTSQITLNNSPAGGPMDGTELKDGDMICVTSPRNLAEDEEVKLFTRAADHYHRFWTDYEGKRKESPYGV